MQEEFFQYGNKELNYLKNKDKKLAGVIERFGFLPKRVNSNSFEALVNTIIGQQISMQAQKTICAKLKTNLIDISPKNILIADVKLLNEIGISRRKAEYLIDIADKINHGILDLESLNAKTDFEVIQQLTQLKGIGEWSAQMLMIFSLQRKDILSFGDLAIHRGLRMIYHHRQIDKPKFEKYKRRYSPYASIASFYIWEVAGGKISEMKDYARKKSK